MSLKKFDFLSYLGLAIRFVLFVMAVFVTCFYFFMHLAKPIELAYRATGWMEIPAQVHSVAYERAGSRRPARLSAQYSYSVDSKQYINDQISPHTQADEFGDQAIYWHTKLKFLQTNQIILIARVNPTNHQQALLDAGIRWGSILRHLLFLFVFLALTAASFLFTAISYQKIRG